MLTRRIGITWQLTDVHGWGVFGLNLASELIKNGPVPPLILSPPYITAPTPEQTKLLATYFEEQKVYLAKLESLKQQAILNEVVMLHSLANSLCHSSMTDMVQGHTNIGFVFFENPQMDEHARDRGKKYDKIIAGSSWNRDFIREMGFENAEFVSQGVNLERFKPRQKSGSFGDRFVVFSGGKLELRKGQDIVLAAFKRFHDRHPDTLLVSNWHNGWAETAKNMSLSPHFDFGPDITAENGINFRAYASNAGLPENAYLDIGVVSNAQIPSVISECDVALFPNRCEGGTNLVAMETMASGIPCILSANTGHLDIMGDDNCYALETQTPCKPEIDPTGIWGESDIDEIVAHLEDAYQNRERAKEIGQAGVTFMQDLSWKNQTARLVDAISEYMQ